MSLDLWQTLILDNDYEINVNHYPWQIRRKSNQHVVAIINRYDGYQQIKLNSNVIALHIVIATQFVHNDDPDHKTQVDHINAQRNDNRIENLRWTSPGQNQQNKCSSCGVTYDFVNELPDDAIVVDEYNNHHFENYYYSAAEDKFYFNNGARIRILHVNKKATGATFVYMRDVANKQVAVFTKKYKDMINNTE